MADNGSCLTHIPHTARYADVGRDQMLLSPYSCVLCSWNRLDLVDSPVLRNVCFPDRLEENAMESFFLIFFSPSGSRLLKQKINGLFSSAVVKCLLSVCAHVSILYGHNFHTSTRCKAV